MTLLHTKKRHCWCYFEAGKFRQVKCKPGTDKENFFCKFYGRYVTFRVDVQVLRLKCTFCGRYAIFRVDVQVLRLEYSFYSGYVTFWVNMQDLGLRFKI